ncbi:hypothetical protein FA13DRAFT_627238, partial [Coprinellus micaceus]
MVSHPAPMDGSQPDLIKGQEDASGRVHALCIQHRDYRAVEPVDLLLLYTEKPYK